jgi:hypothetical protein
MTRWLASLLFGAIGLGLSGLLGSELGLSSGIWISLGLVPWWAAGLLFNDTNQFAEDVSEPATISPRQADHRPADPTVADDQSLQAAVIELTKQLRGKEALIDNLQVKLTEREFRRSLSRLASVNETLSFTIKLLHEGKLTHVDAIDQLRQEIESAVGDLGLEHHWIQVGAAVTSLTAGSFVVLRSETAPTPELAGTVKEVVNSGLFAKDEAGRPHFISPSKINVYKL